MLLFYVAWLVAWPGVQTMISLRDMSAVPLAALFFAWASAVTPGWLFAGIVVILSIMLWKGAHTLVRIEEVTKFTDFEAQSRAAIAKLKRRLGAETGS